MTNEERWKIEGRTRDALREAKKNVTSLRIEIGDYAKHLEEAAGSLRHFLDNPIGLGPTGMTSSQYALHFFQNAIPDNMACKLKEYESESGRVRDLEKQVSALE